MKALGIVRKADELGRVVIPKELRDSLGIEEVTPLEIFADSTGILLRKYSPGCTLCGGTEELVDFGGTKVCKKCARAALGKG